MNARIETGLGVVPSSSADVALTPGAQPPPAMIPRLRDADPFAYASLRERGLAWVQALSGELWTDFNHHDPGVTLLEALCFALTEDVYGAEQPLVDQLVAPDGKIHYRRLGLHAAEEILPCRPCTPMDYICWLLDRVPGALQAHASMPGNDGLWRLDLEVHTTQADDASAAAARAYWAQRNLSEDLASLPAVLQPRWCRLQLDLSVEGSRTPEDILAELVARCAEHIDAVPRRQSLHERLAGEGPLRSLADAFEGPRLRQGWIDTESLAQDLEHKVYFGDLTRMAQAIEGVTEVRRIELLADGLESVGGALPRSGDGWALRLRWPDGSDDLTGWHVTRRGNPISLDIEPLLHRLDDLRRTAGGRGPADNAPDMAGSVLARPTGVYVPPSPYVSLYRQLPRIYRERFDAALTPSEASDMGQFQGYLALLEQWLAHGASHTRYVRDLYTISPEPRSSYGWQMLGDENIPGVSALYANGREQARETVFASADAMLDRRGRVLDHLLALYGEACGQGSIRPFDWYFGADAWRPHLFEQKRQMLMRVAPLTRDRYGAIDYSRRSLGRRGNTAVLQQRVSLLLAFKHSYSRLLMTPMTASDLGIAGEATTFATVDAAPKDGQPMSLWGGSRRRIVERLGEGLTTATSVLGQYFPDLDLQALPPALLRCAVHADRYRHIPSQGVWLGPDENRKWWRLGLRSGQMSTEAAAVCLHEFACRLQLECEGMHLVEHLLLRPIAQEDKDVPDDFYRHTVTVVFAGWTARGRDPSFRRVAEETLSLNVPAHLRVQTLWLDAAAMLNFERSFAAWLEAKQAHCAAMLNPAADHPAATERLEGWTRLMRWLLWRQLPAAGRHDVEGAA